MIPEMFLADGGAAALTMKNEQTAQIGIGQTERMLRRRAPVRHMTPALGTCDSRIIGIAEIPIPQEFRKGVHGLGHRRGLGLPRAVQGREQRLETLPQAQGKLNRNNAAALIREIVNLFLHEMLLGGKRCWHG